MNLSSFQSQARAVTPDGKLTPEFLRLLSALFRNVTALTNDQSLEVFAGASGGDSASEASGFETVAQTATVDAQEVCADVMQPVDSSLYELKAQKGQPNGYVGLDADRHVEMPNEVGDFVSELKNVNTDARLYELPDRSGNIPVSVAVGIDASITTGSLVGKTITVEKGVITGFA